MFALPLALLAGTWSRCVMLAEAPPPPPLPPPHNSGSVTPPAWWLIPAPFPSQSSQSSSFLSIPLIGNLHDFSRVHQTYISIFFFLNDAVLQLPVYPLVLIPPLMGRGSQTGPDFLLLLLVSPHRTVPYSNISLRRERRFAPVLRPPSAPRATPRNFKHGWER